MTVGYSWDRCWVGQVQHRRQEAQDRLHWGQTQNQQRGGHALVPAEGKARPTSGGVAEGGVGEWRWGVGMQSLAPFGG